MDNDPRSNWVNTQAKILFGLILLNFLAQVPYFFHLYAGKQSLLITARSFLIMGLVFAFFLVSSILLFRRQKSGFWLMMIFLTTEFLFYLLGILQSSLRGFDPFFQVNNPDILLRIVYSIGYLNLFVSGYFLLLLITHREVFQGA